MVKKSLNEHYLRALAVAVERTGKDRGAASWLARELGISRQLLLKYSKTGFPLVLVSDVAKIIGAHPNDILMLNIDIPFNAWRDVPKSIADQATIKTQLRRK